MIKRLATSFFFILLIAATAYVVIGFTKGYRLDFGKKSLSPTGVLAAYSFPDKASVIVDGKLRAATNTSFSLNPGKYQVRISKEGYQPWEKDVTVSPEVVTQMEALLIPNNPNFRSLTSSGLLYPTLSNDGTRLAYIVPPEAATISGTLTPRAGVWVYDMRNRLVGRDENRPWYETSARYDWKNAKLYWSADGKQILVAFISKDKNKEIILQAIKIDEGSQVPAVLTPLGYTDTRTLWKEEEQVISRKQLNLVPPILNEVFASVSSQVRVSPDETKLLYMASSSANLVPVIQPPLIGSNTSAETRVLKKDFYYVYDIKEDKNFEVASIKDFPSPQQISWYSNSRNLVMIDLKAVTIADYDGNNRRTIFSGPISETLAIAKPAGGSVMIFTNLNSKTGLSNIYELDLR